MIKKLIKTFITDKTIGFNVQFFRYLFAGGSAFVINYVILIILRDHMKLELLIANSIAFMTALFVNYAICKLWVFKMYAGRDRKVELLVFLITGLIGLSIDNSTLWFFTEKIHIDYKISKLISTGVAFFWNFLSRKFSLFNKVKEK